jgi:hypothetical protein
MKREVSILAVSLTSIYALVSLSGIVHGQSLRTVALSGQHAPGTSSGISYLSLTNIPPALNNIGQTAFVARLTNHNDGIWSEGSGSLSLVALEPNQAPGAPTGAGFVNFDPPVLNAAGRTAFPAIARQYDALYPGVWIENAGGLEFVSVRGIQAPGTPSGVVFRSYINGLVLMNSGGQTGFYSSLEGNSVNETNDVGIWSGTPSNLNLVAREGDQAPDSPSGVLFLRCGQPVLSDLGQVAFAASLVGVGDSSPDGVWRGSPGNVRLVTREGNHAPGTSGGVNFLWFSDDSLEVNGYGQIAFRAGLTGSGVTGTNNEGIWSEGSGSLNLVARRGDDAPGTAVGIKFGSFDNPLLNAAGHIAFASRLSGAGVTSANDRGIWIERAGILELVAQEDNQAPGAPSGVKFSGLSQTNLVFNAAGQIAFQSSLRGSGVNSENDLGLWATDLEGTLHLILRTGDLLEVAPSDFRTISGFEFHGDTGNEDGRVSGFNDLGQLAFFAYFTDGSSGIFVSNLVAVPEPIGLVVFGAYLLSFARMRRK